MSATVRQPKAGPGVGSICFVTSDLPRVVRNGGIGTYVLLMSRLLARAGWRVVIFFAGWPDDEAAFRAAPEWLARDGIGFCALDALPSPRWTQTDLGSFGGGDDLEILSQRIADALPAVHAEHDFDFIEFPDWGGLAFRTVQAKRTGLALHDVPLGVKLHGTSRWNRVGNMLWPDTLNQFSIDFRERYAFEHADVQQSESRYMAEFVRGCGWRTSDVQVVYPMADTELDVPQMAEIRELVFFGRLEIRKGLDLFLDALDRLESDLPVVFLGRDTRLGSQDASSWIGQRMRGREFRIETTLAREAALAELSRGDRLVVMPSRVENTSFAVSECIMNRLPFIAADVGGVREILPDEEAQRRWLFEPTVEDLLAALERQIGSPAASEADLRGRVREGYDTSGWNETCVRRYADILGRSPARRHSVPSERPSVTVAVAHYNHGAFLPAALASIAAQAHRADEVIVIDDGSDEPASQRVFDEQQARYADWTFIRQPNGGPGAARNACLERARGDYFLGFDSDNLSRPEMLGTLLDAAIINPGLAALSCHHLGFAHPRDLERSRYAFRYAPLGGPLIASLTVNVFGDSCSLFRTDVLRHEGGFELGHFEDHATFIKLVARGHQVDVVPKVLFDYRTQGAGRYNATSTDHAIQFGWRRQILDSLLADADIGRRDQIELWESVMALAQVSGPAAAAGRRSFRTPQQRFRELNYVIADQRRRDPSPAAVRRAALDAILRRRR